jgi:aspartate kinase
MIVMKFGGSSVESRAAISRVVEIIKSRVDEKPLVVVSAMGKTTNRLLEIAHFAARGERARAAETLIQLKSYTLREGGTAGGAVLELFSELEELTRGLLILGELTPRTLDAVASFGERISSLVILEALQTAGVKSTQMDSRSLIVTDDKFTKATPLLDETRERCVTNLVPLLESQVVVVGGFIGSTRSGVTTTLGRGGSDCTASVYGAVCSAREIQIWTDVDGMLTCDPRVLPGGYCIKKISFSEAAEMAYFGAKVLHPETVLPAIQGNIPVRVLNSRAPQGQGTVITSDPVPCTNLFKAIASKRDVCTIHIHSTRMLMAHGFLKRIFEIFDRYETPVDLIATSEVSVSLTVDNPIRMAAIVEQLEAFADVSIEERQAIISLVGAGSGPVPGVLSQVFTAIKTINIRMVSQGASHTNLSFVLKDVDVPEATKLLHAAFFSEVDPEVFAKSEV